MRCSLANANNADVSVAAPKGHGPRAVVHFTCIAAVARGPFGGAKIAFMVPYAPMQLAGGNEPHSPVVAVLVAREKGQSWICVPKGADPPFWGSRIRSPVPIEMKR